MPEMRLLARGRAYTGVQAQGRRSWQYRPELEPHPAPEPQFTSRGLRADRTITIKIYESEPAGDGPRQYDCIVDGEPAGAGMALELEDALLDAIQVASDQEYERPGQLSPARESRPRNSAERFGGGAV